MTEVLVAAIGALALVAVGLINRRSLSKLETKNDDQHARGYSLLESIDRRTSSIDDKLDEHGERIAALEVEVGDLRGA